ncbi:hypothetical protein [Tomitella fengzijianii]|uniref:Uncharacterized protein n=1 Tax=Tomitella fengzijianii TaxID=2597660 RepID=A0A516X200_9ACTN|nr:hypothetical protein [Tomitella fengzijianii]QDQ96651.1 hypothetical protein FO059_03950 [Tomitella fengzijianii]
MGESGAAERRGRLCVDHAEVDAVLRALGASASDAYTAAGAISQAAGQGVADGGGDPAVAQVDAALRRWLDGVHRGVLDWAATLDACAQHVRRTAGAAADADAEVAARLRSWSPTAPGGAPEPL